MAKGDMTRNAIINAFMELMEEKSFTEITISNITERCGLNRLTFYYHFQDKYDLLNQVYDLLIMFPFQQGLAFDNWTLHLCDALTTVKAHKKFSMNAMEHDNGELSDHIGAIISQLFRDIIDDMTPGNEMNEEDKKFLADFFSYGVVGTINDWAKSGMVGEPEQLVNRIAHTINDGRRIAVERYLAGDLFHVTEI